MPAQRCLCCLEWRALPGSRAKRATPARSGLRSGADASPGRAAIRLVSALSGCEASGWKGSPHAGVAHVCASQGRTHAKEQGPICRRAAAASAGGAKRVEATARPWCCGPRASWPGRAACRAPSLAWPGLLQQAFMGEENAARDWRRQRIRTLERLADAAMALGAQGAAPGPGMRVCDRARPVRVLARCERQGGTARRCAAAAWAPAAGAGQLMPDQGPRQVPRQPRRGPVTLL